MSMTGALPIWLTVIQAGEEELTSLIAVPLSRPSAGSFIYIKTVDNPITKSFNFSISPPGVNQQKIATAVYTHDLLGASSATVRASPTNKLLCVVSGTMSGAGNTSQKLYASNTLNTEDGRLLLNGFFPVTISSFPPMPIILDVNQYLTLETTAGPTFLRSFTVSGFTVELPEDFSLT